MRMYISYCVERSRPPAVRSDSRVGRDALEDPPRLQQVRRPDLAEDVVDDAREAADVVEVQDVGVLVRHQDGEPVVEVAQHREVVGRRDVQTNDVVVKGGRVAVGRVDVVVEDDLDALAWLVPEQGLELLVGSFGDLEAPAGRRARAARGS